jgi:hypothetical protein
VINDALIKMYDTIEDSQHYLFHIIEDMTSRLGIDVKYMEICEYLVLDRPKCPRKYHVEE